MNPSDVDAYRQLLSRLLDLVDEEKLASVDRDALATGIRVARKTGERLMLPQLHLQQPNAFDLGERILKQLTDADEELSPNQVATLGALVRERLPETL